MSEPGFKLTIEITLTDPVDVWDLYNVFLTRHAQLKRYSQRAPTAADKMDAADRAARWFKYTDIVRKYYEELEQ